MALNKGRAIAADRRRQLVASLLVRNPRITRRQIQEMLAVEPSKGGMRNPSTGKPYSLGIIHKDVGDVLAEWQQLRLKDAGEWISHTLAGYEELEMQAWRDGNLAEVRRVLGERRKLLGIDEPEKHDVTTAHTFHTVYDEESTGDEAEGGL